MKSLTSKWKTWSVILVSVIFIGLVLFGVTGLNKSINAKEHYQLKITATHIQDADKILLENSVENYFEENSLTPIYSATEKYNNGETLIYKFVEDVSLSVDGVKTAVENSLSGKGLTINVEHNVYTPSASFNLKNVIIAYAVFAVVSFVAVLIFDKIKNALVSVVSGVFSGLFALALSVILRIPTGADFISIILFSSIISTAISAGILRICKNVMQSGEKISAKVAADKGALKCLPAICLGLGALLVSAIAIVILGNSLIKEIGLQLVITALSVAFITLAVAPTLWAFVYDKNGAGYKTEKTPLQDTEEI